MKNFIKDFKDVCIILQKQSTYIINNIHSVLIEFKDSCLKIEETTETEMIKVCLENN
jgi:hypothetical protein